MVHIIARGDDFDRWSEIESKRDHNRERSIRTELGGCERGIHQPILRLYVEFN